MASPNLKDATCASLDAMANYGRTPEIRKAARDEQARRRQQQNAVADLEAAVKQLVEVTDQRDQMFAACVALLDFYDACKRQYQHDAALQAVVVLARTAVARKLGNATCKA